MTTWMQRVAACLLLPALVTVLGTGCSSVRALWRGQHYVLALFQVEDGRGTVAGKLMTVTAPDGTTIKCRPSPLFTSHDITAGTPVIRENKITALRLTLDKENHMPWIAMRENLRDGAVVVIVDGCTCVAVCPVTNGTFPEDDVVQLKGDWDPITVNQIVKYAETNHMLLHKLREW